MTAEFSMETVGGRTLRVARWRWDQPSEHLPILFFNGIGAIAFILQLFNQILLNTKVVYNKLLAFRSVFTHIKGE